MEIFFHSSTFSGSPDKVLKVLFLETERLHIETLWIFKQL